MNQMQAYRLTKTFYWHRGEYPDMDEKLLGYFNPGTRQAHPIWNEWRLSSIVLTVEEMLVHMLLKNMRSNEYKLLPNATYYEEVGE